MQWPRVILKLNKGILNRDLMIKRSHRESPTILRYVFRMANMNAKFTSQRLCNPVCFGQKARSGKQICRAAAQSQDELGFKMMRKGVKEASNETLLSPRFYTTDFDAMEQMFS